MQRDVLPPDLPNAIKHLNDEDFNRLLTAVLAEQERRRSGKLPAANQRKRQAEVATISPTRGQLNAVWIQGFPDQSMRTVQSNVDARTAGQHKDGRLLVQ